MPYTITRPSRLAARVAAALLTAVATGALAWGPQGHRVAGMIAQQRLSEAGLEAVRAILGDESLAAASTWADRMRSDPAPFWQRTAGAYHYVNSTPGRHYRPSDVPARGDAYSALSAFARDLHDASASLEQRQLALRFSIHIVQDLHQPLHANERDDRGGNDVKVSLLGRSSNLHRVWDSGLMDAIDLDDRAWIRRLSRVSPGEQRAMRDAVDPLVWIRESAVLSRAVYPNSTTLTWDYVERHRDTLERRLAQAGRRTAAYLDHVLVPGEPDAPQPPTAEAGWWQRLKDFLQKVIQ